MELFTSGFRFQQAHVGACCLREVNRNPIYEAHKITASRFYFFCFPIPLFFLYNKLPIWIDSNLGTFNIGHVCRFLFQILGYRYVRTLIDSFNILTCYQVGMLLVHNLQSKACKDIIILLNMIYL